MRNKIGVTVLVICLAGLVYPALAQKSFKEGYVIAETGDTIRGYINYRNPEKNPEKIEFKESPGDISTVKFGVEDIRYFSIPGTDTYIKAIVAKDINPVKAEISEGILLENVKDTVFLRVLVEGSINLYELQDERPHYYIRQADGDFMELVYHVIPAGNGTTNYSFSYAYRDQLNNLYQGSPEWKRDIGKARYNSKEIGAIVQQINARQLTYVAPDLQGKAQPVSVFAGAGISRNTLAFRGDYYKIDQLKFDPAAGYAFSLGVDLHGNRSLNALAVRFELSYNTVKYVGTAADKDFYGKPIAKEYTVKQNNITPSVNILYSFWQLSKASFYGGLGVACNFTGYHENSMSVTNQETGKVETKSDYLQFEKFWPAPMVYLGAVINKKTEIGLNAKLGGTFVNFTGISAKNNSFGATVRYHFIR